MFDCRQRVAPLLFVFAVVVQAFAAEGYWIGEFGDDAMHWLAAKALAQGSFIDLADPSKPPILNLLPGFPLLLAPAAWLDCPGAASVLSILMSSAAVVLAWRLFFPDLGEAGALGACAFVVLHFMTLRLSGTLMSDPAFLLFSLLCLAPFRDQRWTAWIGRGPGFWSHALLLGFTAWVRPHGALLIIVLSLYSGRRCGPRAGLALFTVSGLMACVPYLRNLFLAGNPAAYFGQLPSGGSFAPWVATVLGNARVSWDLFFGPGLVGLPGEARLMGLLVTGVLVAGLGRALQLKSSFGRLLAAWWGLYAGAHLLWVAHDPRYAFPLLPVLGYFLVLGLGGRPQRLTLAVLPGLLALFGTFHVFAQGRPAPVRPSKTYEWIARQTPPDAILFAGNPHSVHLATGRRTLRRIFYPDADYFYAKLREREVTHLLFHRRGAQIALSGPSGAVHGLAEAGLEIYAGDPRRYRLIYGESSEAHAVYEVLLEPGFMEAWFDLNVCLRHSAGGDFDRAADCLEALTRRGVPLRSLKSLLKVTKSLIPKRGD